MSFLLFSILYTVCIAHLASSAPFLGHGYSHEHQHLHEQAYAKRAYLQTPKFFSVNQVLNPCFKTSGMSSGPAALQHAFLKHNIPMSAVIAKPSLGKLIGSAIASPNPSNYDREYLVPVTIGSVTPQNFNLDLDSGSSDLSVSAPALKSYDRGVNNLYRWVFSDSTPPAQAIGHTVYKPNTCNLSKCAKLLPGETWSILYSDSSSSSGIVYSDTVTIGGVTFPSQAVEAAQQVSSSFTADTANSGLVGMAFSTLNSCHPKQQLTWFDNIKTGLAEEVWTANLRKGAAGTYNFGYIDSTAYTGRIAYTPVSTSKGLWEFTASGYQLGSSSFVTTKLDAIADTGTTLILLPAAVVESYWSQVPSAYLEPSLGAFIFPCSSQLPSFQFGIGSYRGVVPGSYMDYGPLNSYWCYGGIQSQGGSSYSIFGDVLLKAQFVVFDVGKLRIGFAAKKT